LERRLQNVLPWVERLRRLAPISALSLELVRCDTQLLQHPEICGVAYQQGTLSGYQVRAYLVEQWERSCAYCMRSGVPLQLEHLTARSGGGSDAVCNLTLACEPCTGRKGSQTAAEFGFPQLAAAGKHPLRDAAAVNATRWARSRRLQATGLSVEVGTGGRT